MSQGRVFAYCHDSVGIGHLTRTLAICDRVGRQYPFASFLVATGTPYVPLFANLERVDYIKLPALAKGEHDQDGSVNAQCYRGKFLPIAIDHLIDYRKAVLRETVEHFEPDIVLVDKAPLGVCGELLPALRWLRRHRPEVRIVFGMRDIEDAPEATIAQWEDAGIPDALEECFDEVWVYGSRSVFDVIQEYRLSRAVQAKLSFLGYVTRGPCDHGPCPSNTDPAILVTVGGGTDGEFLLRTYLDDAGPRLRDLGYSSVIIGGPDLPASAAKSLRSAAERIPNAEWLDFVPCLNCRIRTAELVVSMGGYNTLCQLVGNRKRALVVPRTKPRREQSIRANLWAQRGLVYTVDPDDLQPATLTDRIRDVLENGSMNGIDELDLGGLDRICDRFGRFFGCPIASAVGAETPSAASVCL